MSMSKNGVTLAHERIPQNGLMRLLVLALQQLSIVRTSQWLPPACTICFRNNALCKKKRICVQSNGHDEMGLFTLYKGRHKNRVSKEPNILPDTSTCKCIAWLEDSLTHLYKNNTPPHLLNLHSAQRVRVFCFRRKKET